MIARTIRTELLTLLGEYPVVTILGPRQAGKSTLAQSLEGYGYSSLEDPDTREFATRDPRAFLRSLPERAVLDEIQRVPTLLSYIQTTVDKEKRPGQFILTGSYQLLLREGISQSLAGRTAVLHLLPLSIAELEMEGIRFPSSWEYCFTGFLPAIHARSLRPVQTYAHYYQTYLERDVRQLVQLKDATLFQNFIRLLAGRTGQIMDYASLASDTGVSPTTVKNWLSILEASFIVFRLPPYFRNFGKRVIKSPKYYFVDVGLLCYLLGITKAEQVQRDPLVGSIFENLVVVELMKKRYNDGFLPDLYFMRDSHGNEVDILFPQGNEFIAVEIKSAGTFSFSALKGLKKFRSLVPESHSCLVYNGEEMLLSDETRILNFRNCQTILDVP